MEEKLVVDIDETKTVHHDEFSRYILHELIDETMEKKDRSLSIYIGEHGVSISVFPIIDEEE